MKTSTHPRLKAAIIISLFAAALLLSGLRAQAQANANPPNFMTYQGYLVDGNGNALGTNAPKNYDVIFRIWDAATGGATPLWAEQQTVTVDKGYFSVLLGEGSSIGEPRPALNTIFTSATASDRWVGLTVKGIGPGGADANILPRLRMLAAPYSYLAQKAITASTVDGAALTGTVSDARLSPNVALRNAPNTFTGNQTITGGTLYLDNGQYLYARNASGAYEGFLVPRWSDNVMYLNYGSSGFAIRNNNSTFTTMFMQNNGNVSFNGNVGIGTGAPGFPLNFASALGDKISLYGNSGNHFGFGIAPSLLQIHADVSSSDIAFGYGNSATMTEVMRIKGNGNVGIGTSNPERKLHVSGGSILIDNSQTLEAKNASGAIETWMWPRWSDNITYLNYGSGGFNIRNNNSTASAMFMQNNGNVYFNGNVGIGTSNPSAKLHLQGPSVGILLQDGGDTWSIYNESGTDSLIFQRGGGGYNGFRSNGAIISGSDVRLKKDIREMENVLPRALKLRPVSYRLKSDTNSEMCRIGFIAQEVEPLFPEVVSEMAGFKGIAYADMVSIAIGAIKELNQIVREQESALAEKATKVDQLEKELATLRQLVAQQTQSQHDKLASDEKRDQRLSNIEQLLRDKFPQQQAAIETSAVSNAK